MLRGLLLAVFCLLLPIKAYAASGDCEAVNNLHLAGVERISAERLAPGPFVAPGSTAPVAGGDLPAFCRVQLSIAPAITIEVWLPERSWNGRYHGKGIGGYGGVIGHTALAQALRAGYATAATDTGHTVTDKLWAARADGSINRQAIDDYGWRAAHETAVQAKAVIAAYYGKAPAYSYFSGCSGGGRQGLMEVQRFPEDYDGVLVGCSANPFSRELPAFLWPHVVMRERLGGPIAAEKIEALTHAVVQACDARDGVVDGIVTDPRGCDFDPARVGCAAAASPICLTPAEVATIRAIWDGPRTKSGDRIWFAIDKTIHSAMLRQEPYPFGVDYLRWVTGNPKADLSQLTEANFGDYVEQAMRTLGPAIDADDPVIAPFVDRGGKLLMWHGDADWADPSAASINYFSRVVAAARPGTDINRSVRLFLLPGVGHCFVDARTLEPALNAPFPSASIVAGEMSGVFPDRLFDALVDWVERGKAPERIIASQDLGKGRARSRPLCAFPKVARWTGRGSTDEAANFDCVKGADAAKDFRTKHDGQRGSRPGG